MPGGVPICMVPRRPQHTPHWKARHYALCWRAGRSGSDKTSAAPTLQQEDHHHHQHYCRLLMQPNHPFHSSFIHLPPVHSCAAFRLSTCVGGGALSCSFMLLQFIRQYSGMLLYNNGSQDFQGYFDG